ncbi:MAG: hypothetical protein KA500_02235 [Rhodoluna sp.]|nr:hypothetical protein [Rhodoluna sp.]MBP6186252.1 hypothetical protein [Rhodoluna sp.]
MEIVFFLLLAFAMLYVVGYAIYKFFSAPGGVERNDVNLGARPNEGQYFDGADGYDATGGYQESRD